MRPRENGKCFFAEKVNAIVNIADGAGSSLLVFLVRCCLELRIKHEGVVEIRQRDEKRDPTEG